MIMCKAGSILSFFSRLEAVINVERPQIVYMPAYIVFILDVILGLNTSILTQSKKDTS